MPISLANKTKLLALQSEFLRLKINKESLLKLIDEAEITESVYNSNAIENSTLTLKETEKVLFELEISRDITLREAYEAKNLASVIAYIRLQAPKEEINKEIILLVHKMLIGNIEDTIAGKFRQKDEYVRVGTHIAPGPEHIQHLIDMLITDYISDTNNFITDKIAHFHLEFERIHPFNDGNGRIGRVLINYLLLHEDFSPITIFNKDKQKYYSAFSEYLDDKKTRILEKIIILQLFESLHKRIAYLKGGEIVTVADYAKNHKLNVHALLNSARRQTIPAFREKGKWKIAIA